MRSSSSRRSPRPSGRKGDLRRLPPRPRALLLLDNVEQVLGYAPRLAELLAGSNSLKVLTTSREPLRLTLEQQYPVPPLPDEDAVALFAERARAIRPDFASNGAVAEICRRLDGLPLAIELAAALVKILPPDALLERLEQRLALLSGRRAGPTRATEDATSDDRMELRAARRSGAGAHGPALGIRRRLEPRGSGGGLRCGAEDARLARRQEPRSRARRPLLDKRCVRRLPGATTCSRRPSGRPSHGLSVFAGGWTLEAAEAVCECDLETLASLVDKSLARELEGRFSMLETIREFARDRLTEQETEGHWLRLHAEYFFEQALVHGRRRG